jgi:hypothetical protein
MSAIPWILVSVAALVVLLGVVFVVLMKKGKYRHEPDYRAFFYIGVIWFPLGVALDFPMFFILGLAYIAIGLANRDKWGKKRRPLTPGQRKIKMVSFAAGIAILVIGIIALLLLS